MAKRFIECSKCKKPIYTTYKQVIEGNVHEVSACEGCPEIAKKLYQKQGLNEHCFGKEFEEIACESCHTKGQDIVSGNSLGCVECYQTFKELILKRLKNEERIPNPLYSAPHESEDIHLHMGKSPFPANNLKLSARLSNLNEALTEALRIENYEQAAWLRDRIKNLSEEASNGEEESPALDI